MVVRIAGTDDCSVGAFAVNPAPVARRLAALGLDRSARPSKQERPCRQCTLVTLKYLTASCAQIENNRRKPEFRQPVERCPRRDDG
jgi:hypothetical protein